MRVIVEVKPDERPVAEMAMEAQFEELPMDPAKLVGAGLDADLRFPSVVVPGAGVEDGRNMARFALTAEPSFQPDDVTTLVRGSIPDGPDQEAALESLNELSSVSAVYADPAIAPFLTCGGDGPVGDAAGVAAALGAQRLNEEGFTGEGVHVAVVDSGINLDHVHAAGHGNSLDAAASFTPEGVPTSPGKHKTAHGTMCAFDVGIVAPEATLLDHAVLLTEKTGEAPIEGLLSDAVLSFSQLRAHLEAMPAERKALVVNNSWGVYDPAWDFPTSHEGNYSDNPKHPFNLIVGSLAAAGADVLFAAGNCGVECPAERCKFTERPIGGANSHPDVISVAGIDLDNQRVGYSSQGPGRLEKAKPDISSYTHFAGSGVKPADTGTSASTPVLAGVIAAFRSQHPASSLSPVQLRALLYKSATELGGLGFDYDHGWGAANPPGLRALLP